MYRFHLYAYKAPFLSFSMEAFQKAFAATCENRESAAIVKDSAIILKEINDSETMWGLWKKYQKKFSYAEDISWDMVMQAVQNLCNI